MTKSLVDTDKSHIACPAGTRFLFILAPSLSIALTLLAYWLASPWIPDHVAIHVGPDGVGYGSALRMFVTCCIIATVAFIVGGVTARGFFVSGHWYQIEKSIVVCTESFAYAVLGVGLGSVMSTFGQEPNGSNAQSAGIGLLSFVLVFIVFATVYVLALPKGRLEELDTA
ncbi:MULTISPECIES: hypothetical protein [unclassified Arthrobacter]|uniref:hypothetical protein n=1 Tax=unclassified Arthrobacter TaxID=235627 RepID=UPI0011AFF681|nr:MULTISPECIES: hypothetical protein [unclassified Arthrobacter]